MDHVRFQKPDILGDLTRKEGSPSHAVIEASAGTGKTFTLKHLVVDLLLEDGASLDEILIVTFTRRATGELKIEVREILRRVVAVAEGRDEPPDIGSKLAWEIGPAELRAAKQALSDFDSAQIYTIHAFCQRLLTDHAFFNEQLFDGELVDEEWLHEECFYEVLRRHYARREEFKPALEMWLELGNDVEDLRSPLTTAIGGEDIVRPVVEHEEFDQLVALDADEMEDVQKERFKAGLVARFAEEFQREVERCKARDGYFTYDDMLDVVHEHLGCGQHSSSFDDTFLRAVRDEFTYALIDEFQDTDRKQWEIFRQIFVEEDAGTVYLIGDPKQSIYGFRGANIDVYFQARKEVDKLCGDDALQNLPLNYRSTEDVIKAYNVLFEDDGDTPFFSGKNAETYVEAVECGLTERAATAMDTGEPITPVEILEFVPLDEDLRSGPARAAMRERIAVQIDEILRGE
ncbi:MAG: UvrD-helicase domain-containing protein, partial [Persicimonas sp.]